MKCEYCQTITEYTTRDKDVNHDLSDKDIRNMVAIYSDSPQQVYYCDHCGYETLQTRVAWSGTLDN